MLSWVDCVAFRDLYAGNICLLTNLLIIILRMTVIKSVRSIVNGWFDRLLFGFVCIYLSFKNSIRKQAAR